MKTSESLYANRMSSDLYDACRLIRDFFDRQNFENFDPEDDFIKMMQRAGTEYRAESQSKAAAAEANETQAQNVRLEVGIFKRKTTREIAFQLKNVNRELQEAESKLKVLQNWKRKLQEEQQAVVEHQDENSSSIIDNGLNHDFLHLLLD